MKIFKPLAMLRPYFARYKREIAVSIVLIIVANGLYAVLPKILQFVIDKIEVGITQQELILYASIFVVLTAVQSLIRFIIRRKLVGMSRKIEYHLRNDYFSHLQKLSLKFFVRNKTGDLMARATNDIRSVAMTIGRGFMFFSSNVVVFSVVIVLMVTTNLKLTLLCLLPFPLVMLVVYKSMSFFFHTFEKIQAKFSDITAKAQENISGVRVIKAYVQEEHEVDQFQNLNHEYLSENLKLAKGRGAMWASMEILFGLAFIFLLWFGGNAAIKDQISIGDFVAFTVWLGMLAWPIVSFGWIINLLQRASASMHRINKIMLETPEIENTASCDYAIKDIQGRVEFKNVTFSYNGEPVLKDINFELKPGKTLALVGPTGSGKTTLINLIPRLIDATAGQVLIDGRDLRSIPLAVLRRHIGFVPQETFLFSETIEENISFGVENSRHEEIDWAAQISTIREDLKNFPEKYQTLIGERGVNLSGGQKQRTAISRALLKKPKILILDDALSSVDTYTEEKILKSLKDNHFSQTNVIISHRISSVKHADLILVLKDGEITQRGSHQKLVREKGLYAELHEQQLLEKAIEDM